MSKPDTILAGIDTGGTFTDFVVLADGAMRHCKVLSTPDDPSRAILDGLAQLGVADADITVVHGSTVGTNAVLENKGAQVAYVTSAGFADVLTLGRQNREQVYQLRQPPVTPPVPSEWCLEVPTRAAADGDLLARASDEELAALTVTLESLDPEAVAVNLLFSFLCPEEETRIAEALGERWFVSLSSRVLPELREYERGIATWLDASVGPVMKRYLDRLRERLPRARISVMQSAGTTVTAAQAPSQAVRLLLSGPAGGLSAALLAGRVSGNEKLLSFDMGGTSTDVSLLDGAIPICSANRIGRWPLAVPSVDIHTIGAGGGSIARVDAGGMLLVGPESAGASPGPACYGQGGEAATVTDANLVLGRIPADTLLGGYLPLDADAAAAALDRLAGELGLERIEAARGVIRLANEHMARALRVMSVERGHDPREYALFSFGGAGGLHACELAELLEIPRVIVPAAGGVLSALGMLASEPGRDLSRAVLRDISEVSEEDLETLFDEMQTEGEAMMREAGGQTEPLRYERRLEMRYLGQSATLTLPWKPGADNGEAFHAHHEADTGHRLTRAVELVNLRLGVRASAPLDSLPEAPPAENENDTREIFVADLDGSAPVYDREAIETGGHIEGPAIITEMAATTWVAPGWSASADRWGNLRLERT